MKHFFYPFGIAALTVAMVACGGRRGQARNADVSAAAETAYVETKYPIEIDISKKYDKRTIILQDVAEVSYVPFETGKDVLMDNRARRDLSVSDSLVVTRDNEGTVFVMGRDGRFISKFKRRGRGPGEYSSMSGIAVDFDRGEVYVNSYALDYKIMVYSLAGEFKRKIDIPVPVWVTSIKSYDADRLLVYTTLSPGAMVKTTGDHTVRGYKEPHTPWYLVSKQTGEFSPLPIKISECRDGWLHQNSNGWYMVSGHGVFPITSNGDGFVLSDYACDTIYTFNAGKLAPFVVPVNARESEDVAVVLRSTRYSVLIVGELGKQIGEMQFSHTSKFL
jgi:hypothetical protein